MMVLVFVLAVLLGAECNSRRCESACDHVLELGCYTPGALAAERGVCITTCRRHFDAPVSCALEASSCEEVAWCAEKP